MKKLKLEELGRISTEAYKASDKLPIVVVLDNIRSALNVGSVFRTTDAFQLEKIVLCGISATPPSREITKTAIGATESVDWTYVQSIVEAVTVLKNQGYLLVAVEQTNQSVLLQDFNPQSQKIALIFGNEVDGISDDILPLLDASIEIAQYGTKHSLNVSICAGIVLWKLSETYRKQ